MSLAFQEFGRGPALVLMHGLFGSSDNLRVLARGLEDRYRVMLPDLPNHGGSPHANSATQESMADEMERFLDARGLSDPVIGGHSIGGKVAMIMALRHPERFPAMVCLDMAPRRYEPSHLEIIAAMRAVPLEELNSRRDADEALAHAVPEPEVRSFLLKNLVREDDRFSWRLNLAAIQKDYDRLLGWDPPGGAYAGPALFVGGARSRYLQEDRDAADIRKRFPNAELSTIPGAGHWIHAEKPAELLEVMARFLGGVHPS